LWQVPRQSQLSNHHSSPPDTHTHTPAEQMRVGARRTTTTRTKLPLTSPTRRTRVARWTPPAAPSSGPGPSSPPSLLPPPSSLLHPSLPPALPPSLQVTVVNEFVMTERNLASRVLPLIDAPPGARWPGKQFYEAVYRGIQTLMQRGKMGPFLESRPPCALNTAGKVSLSGRCL